MKHLGLEVSLPLGFNVGHRKLEVVEVTLV